MMRSTASTTVTGGRYVQLARLMALRSLRWSWSSLLGEEGGQMNWIEMIGAILRISKMLYQHLRVSQMRLRWIAKKGIIHTH